MAADDEERAGEHDEWMTLKSALMEKSLGPEHEFVMHSWIPYYLGGNLDLYYYPHGLSGTAIATKELSQDDENCSTNEPFDRYELVMFTRHEVDLEAASDDTTPFGQAHRPINAILNCMARYSAEAALNPHDTCEFPPEMDLVGGRCLVFADYARHPLPDGKTFGLLAVIEVFRSELNFARAEGGSELIARLKAGGHYPFSDLDRAPVA